MNYRGPGPVANSSLKYFPQNHPDAKDDLRRVGCFWRVGMNIAERIAHESFERIEQLNWLWDESMLKGYMLDQGAGPELHKGVVPIIRLGLESFGHDVDVAEIATFQKGETTYYGWYKNRGESYDPGQRYYIQKIALPSYHTEPFHYRLVDYRGEVIFDPYEPAIDADAILYSIIIEEVLS